MVTGMHDTQCGIAIPDVLDDNPHRSYIVKLRKRKMLFLHFAPDAVDMLGPAVNGGFDASSFQGLGELRHEIVDVVFPVNSLFIQKPGNLLVGIRLEISEGEILKLPFELTDAETVGQRSVDIGAFLGQEHLYLLIHVFTFPKHGNSLGKLDYHCSHILNHGDEHAADGVHLLIGNHGSRGQIMHEVNGLHVLHAM